FAMVELMFFLLRGVSYFFVSPIWQRDRQWHSPNRTDATALLLSKGDAGSDLILSVEIWLRLLDDAG
ncbi:MAG: hypothetical protein WB439_12990, partial [Acidobacteriaceae bacterium]